MPDIITANATMNVRNGRLNARLAYSAAPAACGNLPTSSAYDAAVSPASTNAHRNGSQIAPPTSAATLPVSA